jgi:hypothetical protein
MANASKGDISYTIVETNDPIAENTVKTVMAIEGVFKVKCY